MPKLRLSVFLICALPAIAAIGDNAPPVPATYKQTHPRLPFPDNTYLDAIWAGSGTNCAGMVSRIKNDADAWTSGGSGSLAAFRHLLIAYLSAKRNSGTCAAGYLSKIQAQQTNNFDGLSLAMAYDWTFADLGSTNQSLYRSALYANMATCENNYSGGSPYNDVFYLNSGCLAGYLPMVLAIYPDDAANSLPHLRFGMDLFLNIALPVWRQVIGGGCQSAAADTDTTCGGAWSEFWSDYAVGNNGGGLDAHIVTWPLAWQAATGDPIFTREGWLKNYGYWMMYQTRPDFTVERLTYMAYGELAGENPIGAIAGLAEIYNSPRIRAWGRLVTSSNDPHDGTEPSAWPYYTPDCSTTTTICTAKTATDRSGMSLYRDFPGVGYVIFRTGFGQNDTMASFTYGGGVQWWTHPYQAAGSVTLYSQGALINNSGAYQPGTRSGHEFQYYRQAISRNTITITDTSDVYAGETFTILNHTGSTTDPVPNDGGQRRMGSDYNAGGSTLQQWMQSPMDTSQWSRTREGYKSGKLVALTTGTGWAFAAADITAAYNNAYSHVPHTSDWVYNQANTSNRTFRAQKVVRQVLFIPRGTAAYMVVYTQVIVPDSSFVTKAIYHSLNSPSVSGQNWTSTRSESVTAFPMYNFWLTRYCQGGGFAVINCDIVSNPSQFQYSGKLYAYSTLPSGVSPSAVGGTGHDFDVGGVNYNQCSNDGQCCGNTAGNSGCTGDQHTGTGPTTGFLSYIPTNGPMEPGAWRLEIAAPTGVRNHEFLQVFLATSTSDTNTVSTAPVTTFAAGSGTVSGTYTTTWKDSSNNCTYTVTAPQYGVGMTLTATGSGCATVI